MGRYPTIDPDREYLDPRNPFYTDLINASKALSKAEDNWYKRRRDVFDQYDFGDFDETDGDVEEKYDKFCGSDPWNYKTRFDSIDPTRSPSSGDGFRLVQNIFDLSEISEGYADIYVENGTNKAGYCGGDRYVAPEDRKTSGSCQDDPAPRVLNYHIGRGKNNVDCLYFNLAAFKSSSSTTSLRYYEETGSDVYEEVDVFKTFGETPFSWEEKSGYGKQALSAMKAAGDDYEREVRPYINSYENALNDYNTKGGGELNFDYLDGTIEEPWDGFDGDNVSYNRPGSLPGKLVRQVRGVPKASD